MINLFISIVVPVYNGARTIDRCIASLVDQTYPAEAYEIIVVDNNSTDDTCARVGKYPNVALYHERNVQTSYAARNRGISVARGDIVAFTDADCVADTAWLAELVQPFADESVGAVGGGIRDSDPQNDVERFLCALQPFGGYQQEASFLPALITTNAAYRRDVLEQLGGFEQRLFTAADVDLAWRVQLETPLRVVHVTNAVIYHQHRASVRAMARQFRRHGFGELFLDAMYRHHDGYRRTGRVQARRMARQLWALVIYLRAAVYRNTFGRLRPHDKAYYREPFYRLVVESSSLWGKGLALWHTRLLSRNPRHALWEDPGER